MFIDKEDVTTKDSIGMVINYYWRPTFSQTSRTSTHLCMQKLKENDLIGQIVLVDGSFQSDKYIRDLCRAEGIEYVHKGRELGFAESYNIGWRLIDEPFIGLVANDIYPQSDTLSKLYSYLCQQGVGCVFPYLSFSDYPGQTPSFVRSPISCEPTWMTLNINIFRKEALASIGGIDERYSGSYNDIIALVKLRQCGYRVILVGDTNVTHLGRATISQGSNYQTENDFRLFSNQFQNLRAKHGKWQIKHWVFPFAINKKIALLWWVTQNVPSTRMRKVMERFTIWLEPDLTRVNPTKWKNQTL